MPSSDLWLNPLFSRFDNSPGDAPLRLSSCGAGSGLVKAMSIEPSRRKRYLLLTLLFFVSIMALSQGIGKITGVTAKDEYHLALRTPLSMMEQGVWIVPYLDGAPRIKKPPMINWLTRASFEVFGVSLRSARMVSVLFAALFVLVVALIGVEYTGNLRYGLCAGLIALSTVGVAIQSKYLVLDVPTATFSGFAFYWFLKWGKSPRIFALVGVALSLSGGFLTKGPVVFVVFGSGVLALFFTSREIRAVVSRSKGALMGTLVLFLGLTTPWFLYVYLLNPDNSVALLQHDIAARRIGSFTILPIAGVAMVSFPWTFVLTDLLIRPKSFLSNHPEMETRTMILMLWLGLSVLPFLFVKAFIRYLIGSLIPIALLCAAAIECGNRRTVHFHGRLGMIVTSVIVLFFAGFSWWFRTSRIELAAVLGAYALFSVVWWQGSHLFGMALSATVLWMVLVGFLYPTLGINAIPTRIFKEVKGRPVILFRHPQPSLLPIKIGRSLKRRKVLRLSDVSSEGGRSPLIFATQEDAADLEHTLGVLGVEFEQVDNYKTLSSRVSWIKFARKGATWNDWILALRSRSLEPIKRTIVLYDLKGG